MTSQDNNRWDQLSMRQKADLIRIYAKGGFLDMQSIRDHYNKFGKGGNKVTSVIPKEVVIEDVIPEAVVTASRPTRTIENKPVINSINNRNQLYAISNYYTNQAAIQNQAAQEARDRVNNLLTEWELEGEIRDRINKMNEFDSVYDITSDLLDNFNVSRKSPIGQINRFDKGGQTKSQSALYSYINNELMPWIVNGGDIWADTQEASNIRQYLYNNNASSVLEDIYNNYTSNDRKKTIDSRFIPTKTKEKNFSDTVREGINNAAPYVVGTLGAVAALPIAIEGAVAGSSALAASRIPQTLGNMAVKGLKHLSPGNSGGNFIGNAAKEMLGYELFNKGTEAITGTTLGNEIRRGISNVASIVPEYFNSHIGGPFVYDLLTESPTFALTSRVVTPLLENGVNIGAKTLEREMPKLASKVQDAKKTVGKKLGYVEDMNNYSKAGRAFRIVDKPAIDDAIESRVIRSKTGLYHNTPQYLRENFGEYLNKIPNWETMDAGDIKTALKELGAFDNLSRDELIKANLTIRNSTNHGNTVGYMKDMPYPNYTITPTNYVIDSPGSDAHFAPGHHGSIHPWKYSDSRTGAAVVIDEFGEAKGASLPVKGSQYWSYSPWWGMWRPHKFRIGGLSKTKATSTKPILPTREQIISSAWRTENPRERGKNADGTYSRYPDDNGIDWDVGPGLKIGASVPDKETYTREELDNATYQYGLQSLKAIGEEYNTKYGTKEVPTPFDTVSVAPKLLLMDTRYQNGRIPRDNWGNLYQAIADGDWGRALVETRSKYTTPDNVIHYDNDRVRRRAEAFFPNQYTVKWDSQNPIKFPIVTRHQN